MAKTPTAPTVPTLTGINVLLPTDLHRAFRARAVMDGLTMTQAVEAALVAYLGK